MNGLCNLVEGIELEVQEEAAVLRLLMCRSPLLVYDLKSLRFCALCLLMCDLEKLRSSSREQGSSSSYRLM